MRTLALALMAWSCAQMFGKGFEHRAAQKFKASSRFYRLLASETYSIPRIGDPPMLRAQTISLR